MLTAVPALHARWAGALLSVNSRSVEVLASSDGLVLDRMCIDAVTAKNGGTEWDLKGYTYIAFQVLCIRAKFVPGVGAGNGTLSFAFNDDARCAGNFDHVAAAFVQNNATGQLYCPWVGVNGTGLEGYGNVQGNIGGELFGYTNNGYYVSDFGDLHVTTTVCAESYERVATYTNPQIYQIKGANAVTGQSQCFRGCCAWAWVDIEGTLVGHFKPGDSLRAGDCPTEPSLEYIISPWTAGDPGPDQPSPAATLTQTPSPSSTQQSVTGTATASLTATTSATSAATATLTATTYPVPAAAPLSNGAIGGIVAGASLGSLVVGGVGAAAFVIRRRMAAATDRQSLLTAPRTYATGA